MIEFSAYIKLLEGLFTLGFGIETWLESNKDFGLKLPDFRRESFSTDFVLGVVE